MWPLVTSTNLGLVRFKVPEHMFQWVQLFMLPTCLFTVRNGFK